MDLGLPRSNLGVRVSAELVRLVAEILEPPRTETGKSHRGRNKALLAAPPPPPPPGVAELSPGRRLEHILEG